jgi:hypothetical protein
MGCRKWREDHAKNLRDKDERESVQMEELRNQAKKELSDWYELGCCDRELMPKSRGDQGPDVMIFKYFRRKIQRKMAFLTQNKAKLCKILIITLVF